MIHQARRGPLSLLGINPLERYYGDYATPQDFLIMLGQYLAWTGDLATVRELLAATRRAADWLDRYADLDGDGFLEYQMRSPDGVKHQGWKDAPDSLVDEHGVFVEPPVATAETQAFWYVGLEQAASAFIAAGDVGFGLRLLGRARRLRTQFNERFWLEDEGSYAMALGPDKRAIRAAASNPIHLLASGIVPEDRATCVADRLMAPDLFSGWGVRTLSSANPAYDPFSYHRGSVWPVEQGTLASGLARYGLIDHLHTLASAVFDLSELFVANRLPETVAGTPRDAEHPHPGLYPAACAPQGWSASAIVIIMQALLGFIPVATLHLLLVNPQLPPWLPDLKLSGVRVEAEVELHAWRTPGGQTRFRARVDGRLRVVRQRPPGSGNFWLRGLLGLLLPGSAARIVRI
jgi:glycogen debranching enzyme